MLNAEGNNSFPKVLSFHFKYFSKVNIVTKYQLIIENTLKNVGWRVKNLR